MTSHEFFSWKLMESGGKPIYMGYVLLGVGVLIVTWITLLIIRRALLKPKFIINKIDSKRRNSTYLIVKFVGWVISVFVSLKVMGFEITSLLLGSTFILIGIGFGLQKIFQDFVSGLFLLFEGSLKIGDVVEVDGVVGKVIEINLRSSEILTRDDVTIIIPNSKFSAEKVTNWSHDNENVRFTIDVNVAYGSDVEKVFECLENAMAENEYISSDPSYFVRFKNFGESALEFEMIFWSKHGFVIDNVKSDLRRVVYKKLADNNLAIPFPQRDVHIKGMEHMVEFKQKEKN